MNLAQTKIPGVYFVDPQRHEDRRGFFCRTWCAQRFAELGLNPELAQCSISFNLKKGTLRGMHYQAAPHQEAKLVRCTMGAIFDVAIDLRPRSATYLRWVGVELSAENRRMLYLPEGVAHGFQTLCDNTEVFYQISTRYEPRAARGVRWDDPLFGIEWPCVVSEISERDRNLATFAPERLNA